MGVLSKLALKLGQPVLETNCYETIHTWNPSCTGAVMDAIPNSIIFSLKTYCSFYLLTNIVSKKGRLDKINWKHFFLNTIQSSAFLVTNMSLFVYFICILRRWLGFFTPVSMGLITGIVASACSILVEKKSRRPALALYLTNLASETFYRHLVLHGKAPKFKYGECIPFGVGLAIFAFLQSNGSLPKAFNGFMNAALKTNVTENIVNEKKLPKDFNMFLSHLRKNHEKTAHCQHLHSCISHSAESFTYNFGVGLAGSTVLTLIRNIRLLIKDPLKLIKLLISYKNFRLPFFVGTLPLIFNISRCFLNRVSKTNQIFNNTCSAFLASLSMTFFPSVSIAMYCLWKAIEALYFDLVKKGYLPKFKNGEFYLYAVSTGYVLWHAVIEPPAMRQGYVKFLSNLTSEKLRLFNKQLYDHFGYFNRYKLDIVPSLNTKYTTINPMLYQPLNNF